MVWMMSHVPGLCLQGHICRNDRSDNTVGQGSAWRNLLWHRCVARRKGKLCTLLAFPLTLFKSARKDSVPSGLTWWCSLILSCFLSSPPQVFASHLSEETKWIFYTITSSMLCSSRVMGKWLLSCTFTSRYIFLSASCELLGKIFLSPSFSWNSDEKYHLLHKIIRRIESNNAYKVHSAWHLEGAKRVCSFGVIYNDLQNVEGLLQIPVSENFCFRQFITNIIF